MQAYNELIGKLNAFIRKYYKNQLLRGSIYTVGLGLTLWLSVSVLEYFGSFGTVVRTILFFSFAVAFLAILVNYIFIPLSGLFRLGRTLSHEQAAAIIGTHFAPVKDKLLNTLQLKKSLDLQADNSLLMATIEQRTAELRPVPFTRAVDYSLNRRYLRWAVIPVIVTFLLLFLAPSVLTKSTERLVLFGREFKPEAPFAFRILNTDLEAEENADLEVELKTEGSIVPSDVYVESEGAQFRMRTGENGKFVYTFKNVRKNFNFRFFADGFYSDPYEVRVNPRAAVTGFKIKAEYPAYLNRNPEEFSGTGDLLVPEGTVLSWFMYTKNTQKVWVRTSADSVMVLSGGPSFNFRRRVNNTLPYAILPLHSGISNRDTLKYTISVLKDQFPVIDVQERVDSVVSTMFYFLGNVQDDYGFRGLTFHYGITSGEGEPVRYESKAIGLQSGSLKQAFLYAFNFRELDPKPGDKVHYYFSISDNDGVNGSKTTKSAKRIYKIPTKEELRKQNSEASQSVKNSLTESVKEARELQRDAEKLNKQLLEKRNMDWQDKKRIEDLLKKQKELEKKIEDLKKENEINNFKKDQFTEKSEEERLKEEQLQKLMDELMSEEFKELMKKLEELNKTEDPKKAQEKLQDMKFNSEDLQKQLERTLELYKQMELEQLMKETVEQLNELAEKQKELAKETEKTKGNDPAKKEELQKKQEEINKEFEDVRKQLDEIEKKNSELEKPNEEIKNTDQQEQNIQQEQQNSQQNMEKGQNKKASESQQNAGDQMQQLSNSLQQQQQEMEDNNQEEDLESMRRLLDNLLKLSFQQENLIADLGKVNMDSPAYKEITRKQRKLQDDARVIEDSLFALSKRQVNLSGMINKEIATVKRGMSDAVSFLAERRVPNASTQQQYAMASINNLALMLSESIENSQQQMMMKKGGSSMGNKACKKPGQGNPSSSEQMKQMQQMQQKLGEQMQKMAQQMSKQQKEGQQQKPGGQSGQGQDGQPKPGERNSMNGQNSKEFAQMAQQQEQLRKMLQELAEKTADPDQKRMMQELAKRMEENETDFYNKKISSETMRRQNDIYSRMLESEKALREQDEDEQRESNSADDLIPDNIEKYLEWKKLQEGMKDVLRTVPADFVPYYRQKVQSYFNKSSI
ncbi:MAG: hypothetical protein IBJ09_03055 [Bacteroidia bacterium]|nr:hypothetical protein [Bacteroidia bacterium]